MKTELTKFLYILFVLLVLIIGCQAKQQDNASVPETEETASSLEGAWELIDATYGLPDDTVKFSQPDSPIQLKIFSNGHYAHVMNNRDDTFIGASAGTYKIEGNRYTETTFWSSTPENIGSVTTFVFDVEGDSLYMQGPVEMIDANGKKVKEFQRMEEIRRRVGNRHGSLPSDTIPN